MYVESLDSTQATTATQLWIPKPMSLDHDPKVSKQKLIDLDPHPTPLVSMLSRNCGLSLFICKLK